jgi:uncharacterized protein YigA (DUF484 family)
MKSDDVAEYLKQNPEFFEQYADMLAEIHIPHPHGGRTISISERQIVTLREKNKALENKLREIIEFGEENDAIGEKIHRLAISLLKARAVEGLLGATYLSLREDFTVPHVVLRVWHNGEPLDLPEFAAVSPAIRDFAASLTQPYCSTQAMVDTAALFGEQAQHLRSFSYLPLRGDNAFGLLALASEDPQRFYPDMGTLYLKRIGELISAALAEYIGA